MAESETQTYERSQTIQATGEAVFAFVAEVDNLPRYLAPIRTARSAGDERVELEGEAQGQRFESEGYLRVAEPGRRLEWGSDASRKYDGWMEVDGHGDHSHVTVHLDFGPRSYAPEGPREGTGTDEEPMVAGIDAALESIARIVEGRGDEKVVPDSLEN